jgi:hypothetical protein
MVDPDRWLERVNKQAFARSVKANGGVIINHEEYYLGRALTGQRVTCLVNAEEKQFDSWHHASRVKQLPIKGLSGKPLPFEEYVSLMKQEARSDYRRYLQAHPTLHQGRLWA